MTGFLVLMSEGLYKALEAAHGPGQANQVSQAWAEHGWPVYKVWHPRGLSQPSCSAPKCQGPRALHQISNLRSKLGEEKNQNSKNIHPTQSSAHLSLKQYQSPGPWAKPKGRGKRSEFP